MKGNGDSKANESKSLVSACEVDGEGGDGNRAMKKTSQRSLLFRHNVNRTDLLT